MSDNTMESLDPPPLFDNVDIFSKEEPLSDDLFTSAVSIKDSSPLGTEPPSAHLLPELPTLQLSLDKGLPQSPIEDSVPDDVGLTLSPEAQSEPSFLQVGQNGDTNNEQFIQITVHAGSRVGEGMAAYITYRVETKTNMSIFKKNHFEVLRRFSDFLGLHDKLVDKYLRTGRIIPPAPEKSVIGMTKIKMSGQTEQNSSNEFIERRRSSLQRYLQRTVAHPVLGVDPDFREFLENDGDLPRATNTIALSGAGVMRLFNKVGETVNKITYKMDENDPWFEEKVLEIECLENGLRRLHNSVEGLVIARKELAAYTGALAKSCAMLSSCEEHSSLSRCLAHLADLEEKIEWLHNNQANSDFFYVCELLKDYVALIGAIKEVFHERVKVYQNWQHSLLMLNKKREQKAKMELANRPDKGNIAANEITEWEAKVERCQEEFNNISKMIKKEMVRFESVRVNDFKTVFIKHMEDQMKFQLQLVKFWESFLPEARVIS